MYMNVTTGEIYKHIIDIYSHSPLKYSFS